MTPDRELATTFALAVFALASLACGTDTPSPAPSAKVSNAAVSSSDRPARPSPTCLPCRIAITTRGLTGARIVMFGFFDLVRPHLGD